METEEKGFVIKDRRAFDDRGDPREEVTEESPQTGAKAEQKVTQSSSQEMRGEEADRKGKSHPLPEVDFSTLIMSLSSSALFHLGEIADPQTGGKNKDLPLAKHTIDTIAMLKEKTRGNLSDEEDKFIDAMLADLRWRFVKATG